MSGSQTIVTFALAGLTAVSAWFSLGRLAVTSDDTRARVFDLPPYAFLVGFIVIAATVAAFLKPRTSRLWPFAITVVFWLPYIPGPIPAAFLIWDGPIEGLVWAAVMAGLVFDASPAWPLAANPRRAPWIAGAVAAICYATGWWAIADLLPGGDEPHYLVITQSLLLDGDLLIENNHSRGDYRVYKDQPLKPDFIQRGKDGQIYPMHSPGVSVLVLPAFAMAGYAGAVATVIAITAGASMLAWQAAFLIAGSAAGAWLGWAAVFLTTPFFFHGFTIYPDGTAGLFTAAGVWLLVMLERRLPVATWQLAAVGAALSVLPWLHARFALIAGALGGAILLRIGIKRAVVFLAAPAVVAASWFAYFWIIWGTPNPSAPQGRDLMMTTDMIWRGLPGLFVDQQFGLIAHAPIYALAIGGFVLLARRHPRLSLELALASLPYIVITSSFAAWWGGVSAPARYLAALMPIAALPLAWWWREMTLPSWRATTLLLLLLSVGMVVPKLAVNGGLLAYNDRAGFDLLAEWITPHVDLAMSLPSLHRQTVAAALTATAIWIAALLITAGLSLMIASRTVTRGGSWTAASLIALAAVTFAVSLSWSVQGRAAVRPATSQLALIQSLAGLEVRNVAREVNPREAWLRASRLPAGEYELLAFADGPLNGELTAHVGRTDLVFERWQLDGRQPGATGLTLKLAVPVHSVTIRGNADLRDVRLRLKRRFYLYAPPLDQLFALRAARYGRTQVYFFDEATYPEPTGFWTRGEDVTTVAFAPGDRDNDLTVLLQAGPVPTTIEVSAMSTERWELVAGQQRPFALSCRTIEEGMIFPCVLKIRTGAWFRPSDRNPQDKDTRRLGVFGIVPD